MISSLLDTDLYKLSMQQCILRQPSYASAEAEYAFTNRGGTAFSSECVAAIKHVVAQLADLTLTDEERTYLGTLGIFSKEYLEFLSEFKFRPSEHVRITHDDGVLAISITGLWVDTILYEVPVMALISEEFFKLDQNWDLTGQAALAEEKASTLFENGCMLSEFGTRRRRSFLTQKIVLKGLHSISDKLNDPRSSSTKGKGKLVGTSNVHFARLHGLKPIGTMAHEFIMATAAMSGYEGSNGRAMDIWESVYTPPLLSITLTDTFTLAPFFADFCSDPQRARRWIGMRQDSGDPFKFIPQAISAWEAVGVKFGAAELALEEDEKVGRKGSEKMIVFSDSLDVDKCVRLQNECRKIGVGASFGVGTFLTNDFKVVGGENAGDKSSPLNMVIKLRSINGIHCVKISEDSSKFTGDATVVAEVRKTFGLA